MAKTIPTKNLESNQKIQITENGLYPVSGGLPLAKETIISDSEGTATEWFKGDRYPNQEKYALCRREKSKNKPYCDSTHVKCPSMEQKLPCAPTFMKMRNKQ